MTLPIDDQLTGQDLEHFRGKLRSLLGQAGGTSDRIQGEYLDRGVDGLDTQGDAGADGEFEEVDLDALDIENTTAEAAVAALKRIADGTYGRCTGCTAQIPRGRLEVVPYTPLCVSCEEKVEREA